MWPTPAGGMNNQSFINLGFNDEYTFQYTVQGSEGWKLMDMNGDNINDLLVYNAWDSALYYPVQFGVPGSPHWEVYLNSAASLATEEWSAGTAKVTVYPNPAGNALYLRSSLLLENTTYALYTIDGRCIKPDQPLPAGAVVDISTLPSGLYLLELNGTVRGRVRFVH